ncbi:MAG: hypothetical protein ACRCXX_11570 [Cetobacterium sp.]|uniref:hypothetical protein n=1 Tax=Cetobacterium sp. TaxID=2071632 RepID=UPI003F3C8B3D
MKRIIDRIGDIKEVEYVNGIMFIMFGDDDVWKVKCSQSVYNKVLKSRSDYITTTFVADDDKRHFDFVYDEFLEMRKKGIHPLLVRKRLDLNTKVFRELVEYSATKFGDFEKEELDFIENKFGTLGRSDLAYMLKRSSKEVSAKINAMVKKKKYNKNKSVDNN